MRLKSAWLILAALCFVALSGPRKLVAASFSKHMEDAKHAMSKGDFESAITEYKAALLGKPKSIAAQSWLGMAYKGLGDRLFNNGETAKAIEAYKSAIASVPEDPYWHEQLGIALEKKGDREAALTEYHTAAELTP